MKIRSVEYDKVVTVNLYSQCKGVNILVTVDMGVWLLYRTL